MSKGFWGRLLLGLVLATAGWAADHVDSPTTNALANRDLDITDVYIFRSPQDANNVVIMNNHQSIFNPAGGIALTTNQLFATDGLYQTFIDRNNDLSPDITITTRFTGTGQNQNFIIDGLTATPIIGQVTPNGVPPIVVQQDGITAFCGPRDDPFFFDLAAFNDFLFGTNGPSPYVPAAGLRRAGTGAPQNFFRGNVASIVLEIPVTRLTGGLSANSGSVRIWSKTFRVR